MVAEMIAKTELGRLFYGPIYETPGGPLQTYHCDAASRIDAVKRCSDRAALEDALQTPELQKSVADAIHRRLRKLGFVEIPS